MAAEKTTARKQPGTEGGRTGVLFVCLGNICRSPAAEGTFLHLVRERGVADRFDIDSCGTSAYHIGEPANSTSRSVARGHGIELPSRARQFAQTDFARFDYIFAMDGSNLAELESLADNSDEAARLWKFRCFDPESRAARSLEAEDFVNSRERNHSAPDVPDPYYGGRDGFTNVQQIMLRTSAHLLDCLLQRYADVRDI